MLLSLDGPHKNKKKETVISDDATDCAGSKEGTRVFGKKQASLTWRLRNTAKTLLPRVLTDNQFEHMSTDDCNKLRCHKHVEVVRVPFVRVGDWTSICRVVC